MAYCEILPPKFSTWSKFYDELVKAGLANLPVIHWHEITKGQYATFKVYQVGFVEQQAKLEKEQLSLQNQTLEQ